MSAERARQNNSLRKNSPNAPALIRPTSAELSAAFGTPALRTSLGSQRRSASAPQNSAKRWTPEALASVWNGQETHRLELTALAKRANQNKKLRLPVEIEKSVDEIFFPARLGNLDLVGRGKET